MGFGINSATSGFSTQGPNPQFGMALGGELRKAGLNPSQVQTVMGDLAKGNYTSKEAFGNALESKLTSMGLSETKVKEVLTSLNGGKAKGADSSDSTASTDASTTASSSDATKENLGKVLEKLLEAMGISTEQVKSILTAANGGVGKDSSSSSSSTSSNTVASNYYSDTFES